MKSATFLLTMLMLTACINYKKGLNKEYPCIPADQPATLKIQETDEKINYEFLFPAKTTKEQVDEMAKCFTKTFKKEAGWNMMYGYDIYFKNGELKTRNRKHIFISVKKRQHTNNQAP